MTTDDFIAKAMAVHADKYDYSLTEYKGSASKVEVICSQHGSFWPTPGNHIGLKSGCPACSGVKRTTLDDFLRRARDAHGSKYDYSKVDYYSVMKKVTIVCAAHGPFEQTPMAHFKGRGCPTCGVISASHSNRMTQQEFIDRATSVHGGAYDYSQAKYVNSQTPIEITCKAHGGFLQKPTGHLSGDGCPGCAGLAPITAKEFIARSHSTHGNRYDYSKVVFERFSGKVEILCTKHGSFWQVPKTHVNGSGCPACAGLEPVTRAAFIARAVSIHGDKYDYGKVQIKNTSTQVEIVCKEHGVFLQRPADHIHQQQGCPGCAGHLTVTADVFLLRAREAHGDRYDYSKGVYSGFRQNIEVVCASHGSFWPSPQNHVKGSGCPKCASEQTSSAAENEIGDWVVSLGFDVVRNDRDALDGLEIDIFIPSKSFGIEYNGAYWHSADKLQNPRFHEFKTFSAEKKGIRLMTVWDYQWANKQNFVKSMIMHQLGIGNEVKTSARKCSVLRINDKTASDFYDKTHIQGSAGKSIANYGLFNGDDLVASMSFGQGGSRRGKTGNDAWELTRLSTLGAVRGGASKLLGAFVKEFSPGTIWSFSDRQHFSGGLYQVLGFFRDGNVAADYRVHHQRSGKIWHKSAWQRKNIPKRLAELGIDDDFDPATDPRTERDMQARARVLRIMDSGKIRWKWQKWQA